MAIQADEVTKILKSRIEEFKPERRTHPSG